MGRGKHQESEGGKLVTIGRTEAPPKENCALLRRSVGKTSPDPKKDYIPGFKGKVRRGHPGQPVRDTRNEKLNRIHSTR